MEPSILVASLMAGEGVVNGFTEKMKEVFVGGYYTLLPNNTDFNQRLVQIVHQHRPTIVFLQIQTEGIITEETAKEIARHSFVINFSGDIRWDTEQWYYAIGQHIQLSTFTNQRDVDNLLSRGIPAEYLEIGFDPDIFRPLGYNITNGKKLLQDSVVAMFNNYGNQFQLSEYRAEIVANLKKVFPKTFSVYGNGWGVLATGNLNSSQAAENEKYNESLIALNISHFNAQRYSSDRLLRALGSGIMVISHRYPGIELDYEVGKHLICYDDTAELIHKIKYYSYNGQEREIIASAGCVHAHNNFTFKHMAQNIKNLYYKYVSYGK